MIETREVLSMDKIPMKSWAKACPCMPSENRNPCCLFCEGLVERLDVPFTWLSVQKEVHERRANCCPFLPFSSSRARVPNRSKAQTHSWKTKAIPTTKEYLWYHLWSPFDHRGVDKDL